LVGLRYHNHLLVKVPRPGDSEVIFESCCHLCYYQSNHSAKVEVISLSALPKDTTSELSGLSSPHQTLTLLNAEC